MGQKRFDQATFFRIIHGKRLMAHPVAGARKELDAILDVLLKILENLEVERTLLDVEIGFLLQRPADTIIDAVPNDGIRRHGKHARVDDRIVAVLFRVGRPMQVGVDLCEKLAE